METKKSMKNRLESNIAIILIVVIIVSLLITIFAYNIWPKLVPYDNLLVDILFISPAVLALLFLLYGINPLAVLKGLIPPKILNYLAISNTVHWYHYPKLDWATLFGIVLAGVTFFSGAAVFVIYGQLVIGIVLIVIALAVFIIFIIGMNNVYREVPATKGAHLANVMFAVTNWLKQFPEIDLSVLSEHDLFAIANEHFNKLYTSVLDSSKHQKENQIK